MVDPARCAPDDDPHHHILTLLGMGMAWRGVGIANEHEKGHLLQRRQASLRPKAVLSFSIWISRKSDVPSKSGTRHFFCLIGNIITNTGSLSCHLSACQCLTTGDQGPAGRHTGMLGCLLLKVGAFCIRVLARDFSAAHIRSRRHCNVACMCQKSYTRITHPCASVSAPYPALPCPAMRVRNVAVAGQTGLDRL